MSTKRRGRKEGNIYQRRDGRWAARVSTYKNGKRVRRWVYAATRGEVAARLAVMIDQQSKGILVLPSARTTVSQFLTQWIEQRARTRLRPKTLASYRQVLRLHVVPYIGHIPIQNLTQQHLQDWLDELTKTGWKRKRSKADDIANRPHTRGVSPRTAIYARAILRSALTQAMKWDYVQRNVAKLVDPPREVKHRPTPLHPEQAIRLLDAAKGHRLGALVTVALAIGLRQGETLGLQWADVDIEAGRLNVRHALQRVGQDWKLVEPKTKRGHRTIDLPGVVITSLRAHRVAQLEERLAAGPDWTDHDFVFTTGTGGPLEPSNVTRVFRALLRAADVPLIRFHDLRHSCASLLLAQGIPARQIMELLGHSKISLTMDVYSHVLPTLRKETATRMDDILKRKG